VRNIKKVKLKKRVTAARSPMSVNYLRNRKVVDKKKEKQPLTSPE